MTKGSRGKPKVMAHAHYAKNRYEDRTGRLGSPLAHPHRFPPTPLPANIAADYCLNVAITIK